MSKKYFLAIGCFLVMAMFHLGFGQSSIRMTIGPSREIRTDMIGVNGNLAALDQPWENDRLRTAFKTLNVTNLRYPAGTLGNYWDWGLGAIDRSVPDSLMIPWVVEKKLHKSAARYTLENLAEAHQKLRFNPVFMLNMLSKDLDHAVTHLIRAEKLGLPIRYIELGNELYFGLPFETSRYPTPEEYGKTCSVWIDSLKQRFPSAKYAVIGTYLERNPRQKNWTARVLAHCKNADAVTFHTYSPTGIDGKQERKSFTAGSEGTSDHRTATRHQNFRTLKERQLWELELLKDSAAYANFLQTAVRSAERYKRMGVPETMEVWATEYNMRADSSALRGSWANALYTAKYYDAFLKGPINLTNIHNITGDLFPQIYTKTDQLGHILHKKLSTVPYTLSAQGVATSLYARASRGMHGAATILFSEVPEISDDRGQSVALLSGWTFFSDTARTFLLVNYSNLSISLSLPESLQGSTFSQYHTPLEHYINNGLKTVNHVSKSTGALLLLPPASFTLIE